MNIEPDFLNNILNKIMTYKSPDGVPYMNMFNKTWLLNHMEEKNEIQLIEQQFKNFDSKGVDLIDFTKAFLNLIPHDEDETLYLTIGLVDLYKDICETYDLKGIVKASDVLNYIVDNFTSREWKTHIIPMRNLPEKKHFGNDHTGLREIDKEAPVVYGHHNGGIMRLNNSKLITDSTPHASTIKRAYFGVEVKKVFTLDSLSASISIYNQNCCLDKRIIPKAVDQKTEIMVLDFAWSSKQQRIGATLKDFSLSFWEATDNYEFEKVFPIANYIPEYQDSIWYIDFMNLWVTTDKTYMLNVWDIEKQVKKFSLSSPKIKSKIIDLISIEILKLVAISSMDKIVTLWDFRKKTLIVELNLSQGGIHSMAWSDSYQVLVTAGYENNINIWSVDPNFLDVSQVGKLVGHTVMVTAIEVVEKTPMIISADDSGKLKVWDLRSLQCLQTVELGHKTYINKIISLRILDKLCLLGSRVNFLEFDRPIDATTKKKGGEEMWPIRVEYNYNLNEIVICTRKEIIFVDVNLGRPKKIYRGLLTNDEDDITAFRLVQQDKKFILGDYRGHITLYSYATGEKIKSFASHMNEVTHLKVDFANKLVVSSSWDSTIMFQKENNLGSEVKKTIKNLHYNKETSLLEMSVYHNILITAANTNILYVWDYEYLKLIATIESDEGVEATYVTFINGYSYVIVAESSGMIHLLHFHKKDVSNITFRKVAYFSLASLEDNKSKALNSDGEANNYFVNRILVEQENPGDRTQKDSLKMYVSTNRGDVIIFDISVFLKLEFVKLVPHVNTSVNYNSDRISHEDFLTQITSYKTLNVYLGTKKLRRSESSLKEDSTEPASLNSFLLRKFKAHKDSLTTLTLMATPDKKILTSSVDGYVKVWDLNGTLMGSLKISHPLPIYWNMTTDDVSKNKKKIFFALKVIDRILKRYKNNMLLAEQKNVSVNRFLKEFADTANEETSTEQDEFPSSVQKSPRVLLMKDEYSPRDLQYDKARIIYQRELQGPSLRQIEAAQRLTEAQRTWKMERGTENTNRPDEFLLKAKEVDDKREKNDFMVFLIGDTKKAMMAEEPYSKRTKHLAKRLDAITARSHKKKYLEPIARESLFITATNDSKRLVNNTPLVDNRLSVSVESVSPGLSKNEGNKEDVKQRQSFFKKGGEVALGKDASKKPQLKSIKIPQKPETTPVKEVSTGKTKLGAKIDFIEYANEVFSARSDTQDMSSTSKMFSKDIKSDQYVRKMRRQKFIDVINKMDQSIKKFQLNPSYLSNIRAQVPNTERSISIRKLSTQASTEKLIPSMTSFGHLRLGSEPDIASPEIINGGSLSVSRKLGLDQLKWLKIKTEQGAVSARDYGYSSKTERNPKASIRVEEIRSHKEKQNGKGVFEGGGYRNGEESNFSGKISVITQSARNAKVNVFKTKSKKKEDNLNNM